MMRDYKDLLYFLAFFVFSVLLYTESTDNNYIQMKGDLVEVVVKNLNGGRLCIGTIVYNEKSYNVELAKTDCYNNSISIGEKIKLKYLKEWDKFILPERKTLVMYYTSLAFFIVPIFFLIKMIKNNFVN